MNEKPANRSYNRLCGKQTKPCPHPRQWLVKEMNDMQNTNLKHRIKQAAILLGVVLIPLMYSFFYLNAFWDPYARLDDVPVAVVNLDEGAVINGDSRNAGQEICDSLEEDGSVGFVFTDPYDAAEGLEGDRYYATITIPENFSANLAAATDESKATDSADVDTEKLHSAIIYRSNQKKNYLAAQILENVMPQVKQQINAMIDEQIVGALSDELTAVPGKLGELADGLEQLTAGATQLKDGTAQLSDGAGQLSDGTQQLNSKTPVLANGAAALDKGAAQLADGTAALNDKAPALADGTEQLDHGAAQLDSGLTTLSSNSPALTAGAGQTADGAKALEQGVGTYTAGVSSAKSGADTLSGGIQQYTQGVTQLTAGSSALYSGIDQAGEGVDTLVSSVESASGQLPSADMLSNLTAGAQNVADGLASLEANYAAALQGLKDAQASGDPDAVNAAIANLDAISGAISELSAGAGSVNGGVQQLSAGMQTVSSSTGALLTGLQQLQTVFGSVDDPNTLRGGAYALNAGLSQLDASSAALNNGASALQSGLGQLDASSAALNSGASQLSQGTAALNQGVSTYTNGVDTAAAGASRLHNGTTQLKDSAPALVNGAQALKDGAAALHNGTATLLSNMPTLQDGVQALTDGAAALTDGAVRLDDGAAKLRDGLVTAKDGVVTAIADAGERLGVLDGLAAYAGEPVVTETQYTHPVANYGSAFAPYFMGLSLWVGGLLIFFGIYLDYNRKIRSLTKDSTQVIRQTFLFGALSVAQGLLLGLVIQFGLGIEVAHPAMLYPACILTAWAFTAVIQFCIMHLGDAGKLLAMLLLILQLTSCGGTFPIETQAPFFQVISKFLPMTYSTQLFKEAISGSYNANAAFSAAVLLVYLGSFVALSALFGRKAIHQDVKQHVTTLRHHMANA